MVPVRRFVTPKHALGPTMVVRYNLHPVAPVTATPAPGTSSGDAMAKMKRLADAHLGDDPTVKTEWTELAFLQQETGSTALWAFALSVLLVFLVLAAQYESWKLPLAVILVVPMCLLFAAIGVNTAGQDITIFTQIGLIVLVGLACKNAILIVEFAKQRTDEGDDPVHAAVEACRLRLRPILMTSFAFIFGVLPLAISTGPGANSRIAIGTSVIGGMLTASLLAIFYIPLFFVLVRRSTRDALKAVHARLTRPRAGEEPA